MIEIKNNKLTGLNYASYLKLLRELEFNKKKIKVLSILHEIKKYKITIKEKEIYFTKRSVFGYNVTLRTSLKVMGKIKKEQFDKVFIDLLLENKSMELVGYNGNLGILFDRVIRGEIK